MSEKHSRDTILGDFTDLLFICILHQKKFKIHRQWKKCLPLMKIDLVFHRWNTLCCLKYTSSALKCELAILSKLHCSASNHWCQWSMPLKEKWYTYGLTLRDTRLICLAFLSTQFSGEADSFTEKFKAQINFVFTKVHLCHQRDLEDELY